ncbi:hypothetical protein HETIRDRAFT_472785 [Heterobasidion irregulare TC 32-1]|uniref:ACB domain-containing protein n=1 Tax=Heterobasidion irregulare (strain TC 32-1) TaxID=747525 RepID=W4KEU3_HETIT|nr:uncharacterized protein HETIRDRAFT_472785 [Heterobasidion irregulare TC 32-1]ETW84259.1 hypothetical protein HETIRDRAFT_472785 [Heterobasidion irregulare TC 32-1]
MDAHELIDAQFDRAVEIIQSLPKTGPIQTDYEEKLMMYSLYKQATVGNVKAPRPGIWDMLGKAKWDAWAKHKDLDPYEAKWLYVDALLKVLRKYSDKTVARDLVRELESYEGDPSNIMMSRSLSRGSDSSGSGEPEQRPLVSIYRSGPLPTHLLNNTTNPQAFQRQPYPAETTSDEETSDDEARDGAPAPPTHDHHSQVNRPQSSLSSHRYRTPMAGSMMMTPPTIPVPATQPHPGFETPSAFAGPSTPSVPSLYRPQTTTSYGDQYSRERTSPQQHPHHAHSNQPTTYRATTTPLVARQHSFPVRPASRIALERAVESVQAHLAALTERIETLESHPNDAWGGYAARSPGAASASPTWPGARGIGRGSPRALGGSSWNFDEMGLWSYVLKALVRVVARSQQLVSFLADHEHRSPTLIVVRRLFLDLSFILCVLAVIRVLWRAVAGHKTPRIMVDQGV